MSEKDLDRNTPGLGSFTVWLSIVVLVAVAIGLVFAAKYGTRGKDAPSTKIETPIEN